MFPNFITGYDNLNKHIWDAHQDGKRWELPLRDQKGTKEYINTPKENIFPRLEGSYFAGHGDFKSIPINP
jgi:hypothetical protein